MQIHEGRGQHKGPGSHLFLRKKAWIGATSMLHQVHLVHVNAICPQAVESIFSFCQMRQKGPGVISKKEHIQNKGEKMQTAPDVMVMWIWNRTHQVEVVLGDLLLLDLGGYNDASSDQPNV